jgi:hypothetical protein
MGGIRQVGAVVVGLFIFYAVITATSRLLVMKQLPGYIDTSTKGIANLYNGVFGLTPKRNMGQIDHFVPASEG